MKKELEKEILVGNVDLYRTGHPVTGSDEGTELEMYPESTYELDPKKVIAFIDKHFISKEDVLEMIGENDEPSDAPFRVLNEIENTYIAGCNQAKQEIRDKLI